MSEDYDETRTRRFNRRLILVASGIILFTLIVTIGLFEWTSRRRLDAAIQSWRAAGEPVEAEDFAEHPTIPDDQNAALLLRRAETHIDEKGDPLDADEFDYSIPLPAAELRQVNDYLARNQSALTDLHAAAQLPQAQWKTNPTTWLDLQSRVNVFGNQRALMNLLSLQVLAHFSAGDEAAAFGDITDMFQIAAHIGHTEPTLVGFLFTVGCRAIACDRCERWVTADLHATTRPASTQQRQAIIAALLNTTAANREWHNALIGERAVQLRYGRQFISKTYAPPLERQRLVSFLRYTTDFANLDLTSQWPTVDARMQQLATPAPRVPSVISLMRDLLQPSFERAPTTAFRCLDDRRLIATGLAIRWYRIDHDGKLPTTLPALVPQYLPELPDDPYAATPQAYRYLPAATEPCIYSVGENGTDEGGSTKLLPHERRAHDFARWLDEDAVLLLLHPPPQPPKADNDTTPK